MPSHTMDVHAYVAEQGMQHNARLVDVLPLGEKELAETEAGVVVRTCVPTAAQGGRIYPVGIYRLNLLREWEMLLPSTTLFFSEYSDNAPATAVYPSRAEALEYVNAHGGRPDLLPHWERAMSYVCLKLASEAGEVAGKLAKLQYRKDSDRITHFDICAKLVDEGGDVLWYLNELALLCGSTLKVTAFLNLHKLMERSRRGTIKGSGDVR